MIDAMLGNDTFQDDILKGNQELSVYIETPDGMGFEGKAVGATLDMDTQLYRDRLIEQRWTLSFTGTGGFALTQGVDMAKIIASRFLPQEWECKFCGRGNSINQSQCQSCGWYRGIIADVVQEMGIWRPK